MSFCLSSSGTLLEIIELIDEKRGFDNTFWVLWSLWRKIRKPGGPSTEQHSKRNTQKQKMWVVLQFHIAVCTNLTSVVKQRVQFWSGAAAMTSLIYPVHAAGCGGFLQISFPLRHVIPWSASRPQLLRSATKETQNKFKLGAFWTASTLTFFFLFWLKTEKMNRANAILSVWEGRTSFFVIYF